MSNRMKQFGVVRGTKVIFGFRPRTPEQWHDLYLQNKRYIFGIKSITLKYGKQGAGQSGPRHFMYDHLPPLVYWNKDVTFNTIKELNCKPELILELENGESKTVDIQGKKSDEIMQMISKNQ